MAVGIEIELLPKIMNLVPIRFKNFYLNKAHSIMDMDTEAATPVTTSRYSSDESVLDREVPLTDQSTFPCPWYSWKNKATNMSTAE